MGAAATLTPRRHGFLTSRATLAARAQHAAPRARVRRRADARGSSSVVTCRSRATPNSDSSVIVNELYCICIVLIALLY